MTPERASAPEGFPWDRSWFDAEVAESLFRRRQLMMRGPLDLDHASRLAAQLMTLEAEGEDSITMLINSTGGDLPSLFTVTDTMSAMHAPVDTRCVGQAMGTAAALVAAGTGRRHATPSAQLLLRLPGTEVSGRADEIEVAAHAERALTDQLFDLLARVTNRPRPDIVAVWQRGHVLTAEQAMADGYIDHVA